MTGKISRRISWFLPASASTVKQACTSLTKKQFRSMQLLPTLLYDWLSPVANGLFFNTQQSDSAVACNSLSRLYWQRLLATKQPGHQSAWLSCLGFNAWKVLSPEFATEGQPGIKVSADENLERFITSRNPQVNCQFQETSVSLCKRRWWTFWAFTMTLWIDFTCACCHCTLKANT